MAETTQRWWTVQHGPGPVLATAIHHGHELRPEVAEAMALSDSDRLREEDPFTGDAASAAATHIIVHRSRFEFDLNRPPEGAVYQTPDQCWGLEVWKSGQPEPGIVERSLALHAEYFRMLGALLDSFAERYRRFVLIDVHSYNHRRDRPGGPATPQELAPDINIGTFSMPREDWAFLLDPLMEAMRGFDFNGRRLDVRENVAFQGKGYAAEALTAVLGWTDRTLGGRTVCMIAPENLASLKLAARVGYRPYATATYKDHTVQLFERTVRGA